MEEGPGTASRLEPTSQQDPTGRRRSQAETMGKLQGRVFLLCLLVLHQCLAAPLSSHSQCAGETLCTYSLKDYHNQMTNLPADINKRSIAAWDYQPTFDLNREPQVIYEAQCQDGYPGSRCSALGLEPIPVTLRMPVLRRNPACSHSYSVDFDNITVACICADPRKLDVLEQLG